MSLEYVNYVGWAQALNLATDKFRAEVEQLIGRPNLTVHPEKVGDCWQSASNSERIKAKFKAGSIELGWKAVGSFCLEEMPGCCAICVGSYLHNMTHEDKMLEPLCKMMIEAAKLAGYTYLQWNDAGKREFGAHNADLLEKMGFQLTASFVAERTKNPIRVYMKNVYDGEAKPEAKNLVTRAPIVVTDTVTKHKTLYLNDFRP